jgi:hypothetical protein
MRRRGRQLGSDRYSPDRVAKPRHAIDRVFDYDFALVDEVSERLRGVARPFVLRYIFDSVVDSATTDTERHLAVLAFLQDVAYHNYWVQPMRRDRTEVFDPLVLLELNEMRCGHVARLAVDLFRAGGYRARLVQVGAHVLAEVYYDQRWHYVDADIFKAGQVVLDRAGNVPSLQELATMPEELDRLSAYMVFNPQTVVWAPGDERSGTASAAYPSSYYFSASGYGDVAPAYYVKTAWRWKERFDRDYGWRRFKTLPNRELQLTSGAVRYQPAAPLWSSVATRPAGKDRFLVELEWQPAGVPSGSLVGYRVSIGRGSRGWQHDRLVSDPSVSGYWSPGNGWSRSAYDNVFRPPPSDVGCFATNETKFRIELESGRDFFVSVTGVDAYGARIGKDCFFASEELVVRNR